MMTEMTISEAIMELDDMQKKHHPRIAAVLRGAMHDLAEMEAETNPHQAERDALPDFVSVVAATFLRKYHAASSMI